MARMPPTTAPTIRPVESGVAAAIVVVVVVAVRVRCRLSMEQRAWVTGSRQPRSLHSRRPTVTCDIATAPTCQAAWQASRRVAVAVAVCFFESRLNIFGNIVYVVGYVNFFHEYFVLGTQQDGNHIDSDA